MFFFAQHFPIEFEGFAGHYLKNHKAEDVEPLAEEPEPAKPADPAYGQAIWASIIVSLIALVGLIIVGPFLYSGKMNVTDQSTFETRVYSETKSEICARISPIFPIFAWDSEMGARI